MTSLNVAQSEIQIVKRMTRTQSEELKTQILQADPTSIFGQAKESRKPDKRYILCPNCGNGSGRDHTPVDVTFKNDRWLYHCFAQNDFEGDLLNIIATEHNLNLRDDMCEALAIGAQLIGYPLFDDEASTHNRTRPKIKFADFKPAEEEPCVPFLRLDEAKDSLPKFFDAHKTFRGLTQETLQRLGWGFLTDYSHPKSPDLKFPAVIIPNDKGGIFARQINGNKKSNITPSATTTINLPADNMILFVVEGAIDAASIVQASDWRFGVISIGGTSGKKLLLDKLKELYPDDSATPNIILLLDNDSDDPQKNSGQKAAKDIAADLQKIGFTCVNRIISDTPKRDANIILNEDGQEVLRSIIDNIVSSSQSAFDQTVDREKIKEWQKHFGKINPSVLKTLKDAASRIQNTPLTAEFAKDLITQEFLGRFRFYSFYSSIEQKFFIDLKDAKKNAKEKIRNFSKDNTKPEPSDDDRALAILDIAQIDKTVGTYFTAAKHEHKNYLVQAECDRLNEKKQAEMKSREDETTAKNVKSCPIDLKIPFDCYFNRFGNSISDNTGKRAKKIIATKNPIVPTKIFRDPTNHNTQYEIAVKTGNCWRYSLVDGQSLFDPRKIIALASIGAYIEEPKALVKFFARILAENDLPEIKCYSQTGWHDGKFIYPTGSDDYIVRRAGFDYEKYFATHGDRELWKEKFLEACKIGGAKVKTFVGSALAALLVRPLNLPNLQVHIYGKSGSGKTALEKLTASIFGNPRKLIGTFAATQKNRIAQAAAFNDLPSFFDELETLNGKKAEESLPEMIYNYAEGKGNQAQKRDGTARETFEFFGSRLMTAERQILRNHDKRGAYKRLIQLYCEKLFEDSFAANLHFVCEVNFGHFGRAWADFVVSNKKKIQETFRYISKVFADFPPNVEPGQLKNACADLMCFQFFLCVLGVKDSFDVEEFDDDIHEIISELPTPAELDDSTRAIADLKSFVAGHEKYFAREMKDSSASGFTLLGAQAWECYGKKFKNGEVAFFPTALRKILENELGYANCDALVSEFASKGFLRTSATRGNRYSAKINGKPTSVYRFKAGVLFDAAEEDNDKEAEEDIYEN